jgi:hypothetical protein
MDDRFSTLKELYPNASDETLTKLAERSKQLEAEDLPLEQPMIDPIDMISPTSVAGKFGGIAKTLGMSSRYGAKAIPKAIPTKTILQNQMIQKLEDAGLNQTKRIENISKGQIGGTFMKDAALQNAKIDALDKRGVGQAERISAKAMKTFRDYPNKQKLQQKLKETFTAEELARLAEIIQKGSKTE